MRHSFRFLVLMVRRRGFGLAVLAPLIAGLATVIAVPPHSAQAQGFFDAFFGSAPKKPASRPRYPSSRQGYRRPRRGSYDTYKLRRQEPWTSFRSRVYRIRPKDTRRGGQNDRGNEMPRAARRGGYRTVCVRSCDGYYFPVNFAVNRSRFARDAKTCRAKCGEDAKLYIMSTHAKPDEMRDLRGRSYAKTKTAFLFRKRRVKSCRCRPAPWEPSEKFRHELYALNEPVERKLARLEGDIDFLSGRTQKRKKLIEAEAAAARLEKKLAQMNGGRDGANAARGTARADSSVDRVMGGVDHVAALDWRPTDGYGRGPALAHMSASYGAGVDVSGDDVTVRWANNRSVYGATLAVGASAGWTSGDEFGSYSNGAGIQPGDRNRYRYRNRNRRYRRYGQLEPSRRPRPVARPRKPSPKRRRPPAKVYNKSPAGNSFWGLSSKPKYRWPGD